MSRTIQYTRKEVTTSRDNNQVVYNNVMDAIAASGLGDWITVKMYGTETIQEYFTSQSWDSKHTTKIPSISYTEDVCHIEVRELDGTFISRSTQTLGFA